MNKLHDFCCPWDTQALTRVPKLGTADRRTQILSRELFYLWNFILQQELWDEARDFLDEYMESNTTSAAPPIMHMIWNGVAEAIFSE